MSKPKRATIEVQGTSIAILSHDHQDFLCLTDIAKLKNPDHPDDVIRNWLRSRSTVEFLGVWERLNNPVSNPVEFDGIRMQTGLNSFVFTPKQWLEKTGAVGITSSAGRYGGTFAQKDIAFEFASWVSVEFKLYLIKEFQRLKDDENHRLKLDWNLQRTLAKINYRIHTTCHQRDAHSAVHHQGSNRARLCQRSRPAQCRPLRPNRVTLTRHPSRRRRQPPRPRPLRLLSHELLRPHPPGFP